MIIESSHFQNIILKIKIMNLIAPKLLLDGINQEITMLVLEVIKKMVRLLFMKVMLEIQWFKGKLSKELELNKLKLVQ